MSFGKNQINLKSNWNLENESPRKKCGIGSEWVGGGKKHTLPIGLFGVLRRMAFVFGEKAAVSSSSLHFHELLDTSYSDEAPSGYTFSEWNSQ